MRTDERELTALTAYMREYGTDGMRRNENPTEATFSVLPDDERVHDTITYLGRYLPLKAFKLLPRDS